MSSSSTTNPNPEIDLSQMSVVNLINSGSQRSKNRKRSSASALQQNDTQRPTVPTQQSSGEGNEDDDPSTSKYQNLIPRPDDEPNLLCKFAGFGDSVFAEFSGWSQQIPTKLFNMKETTRFTLMTDGRGEIVKSAAELLSKRISLRELEHQIGMPNPIVNCPIFVHVVAKKKVDVFPAAKKEALVLPLVVIADESGYCVLFAFNEGVDTLYNQVDVGDKLLISRSLPKQPRRDFHRGLFCDQLYLNLEVKLQFYSVRNHYLWKFSPLKLSHFKMPADLFDESCQIKCPREIEKEFREMDEQPRNFRIDSIPNTRYYDVIGVISYVGRIERFQSSDTMDIDWYRDGQPIIEKVPRFVQYRWIYIIDETSSVIPVKVFVSNILFTIQSSLVPGAIVILSHCQTPECKYSERNVTTSPFTQIYTDGNIDRYYMLHPASFRVKAGELMMRENYLKVIQRPDIDFAVGGTHFNKVRNAQQFSNFIAENKTRCIRDIGKPLHKRESRWLCFEGIIYRYGQIEDENIPKMNVCHDRYSEGILKKEAGEYVVIENPFTYSYHRSTNWYSFQRRLPPVDNEHLREARCRDIVKKVVRSYKQHCEPLLTPAEMSNCPQHGSELEKLDGPPYLMLDIVDSEHHIWYTCVWKTKHLTYQEKLEKLEAAKNKMLLCAAEVFCSEPDAPLEVNLVDFVIDENASESLSPVHTSS